MKQLAFIFICILVSYAGWSQSITGSTPVTVGTTTTYTYNPGIVYGSYMWYLSNSNGYVSSYSASGTTYTVNVTWTAGGTSTLSYSAYGTVRSTKNITINCPTLVTPTATFSYPGTTTGCGSVTIKYTGTPPTGVLWYWQTAANGTALTNSTNTYSATTSGTYYLRAKCGTSWSTTAKATSAVVVKTLPTASAANPSVCSGSGAGIAITNNLASTTNTWTVVNTNTTGATGGSGISTSVTPFTYSLNPTLTATSNVNGTAVYTITPSANGCTGTPITVTAAVKPKPTAAATNQSIFTGTPTTIAITNPNNVSGTTYTWTVQSQTNATGASPGSGSTIAQTLIATTAASGTVTYSITPTAAGCSGTAVNVTATVNPAPIITSTGGNVILGAGVILDGGAGYSSYTWKNTGNLAVTLATTQRYSTSVPGTYQVTVTKAGVNGTATASFVVSNQFSNQNLNYIVTSVLLTATYDSARIKLQPVDSLTQSITYYDGHGRHLQSVITQGSPLKKDMVTQSVYDSYGRKAKQYLSFVANEATGYLKPGVIDASGNFAGAALNFYNNSTDKIADDAMPYTETVFENSELSRPLKSFGVGAGWRAAAAGTDKFVKSQTMVYDATQEMVINWTLDANSMPARSASPNTTYASGKLLVSSTTDEQNHEVRTYTDKLGRVILRKVQAVDNAVLSDTTNHWTNTYYIYDDYGQLRYVLQPQLVRTLVGKARNPNATDLARFAFQYQYDGRNRMVQKQVPGAGAVYMVYDQRNRIVLTQDANQRNQATKEWTFTKYDELNRPVLTGKYASTNTLAAMQTAVNSYYANLTASQAWYETYVGSTGAILGYDNKSFPQSTNAADYYTATYYDRYDTYIAPAAYAYTIESPALSGQPATANTSILGKPTASLVKILTTGAWLRTVTYYDAKYRPIQIIADHPKGTQRTTSLLDFVGRTMQNKRTYVVTGVTKTITEAYTYDHGSRMLKATHSIDGATPIIIAQSNYNELGQSIEKNLHSTDGINYKQSVDFSYNIRGWMTGINQSNIASLASGDAVADYFGMDLAYNNPFSGLSAMASYNGNISSIKWSNGSSKQQAYAFDYDAQNRLLNAHHFDNDSVTWARHWRAYSEMGISYDLNGNILKLKRYGYQGQMMDNLTYGYQGNQLKYVHDTGSVSAGFVNGNTGTDDYTYDNALLGNGNMTADKNKGITAVNYNYLNLPQQVNKGGTDYVVYTYDASGRKWAQQVYGSTPKTTDYLGELIYEGGNLQSIQMSEGRVLPDGAGWEYQYYLKDHLGNVHVTFTTKTQTANTVSAGFESANQTTEATKFKNYPTTSHINVVASNANTGSNSLYLNGAASGQVGLAKDYSVMPGDVVQIQAYAKYLTPSGTGSNLINFAPALLAAFNLGTPAPGETGTASSAVQRWGQLEASGNGNGSTSNSTPKVFVTILLFDRNYNFLDVSYQQLGSPGTQMSASYTVREPGYAYLYVSNEHATQVDVYFDDIVMSHTPGQIVSATDYMPFGLTFRAGERQGATEQKMLYSSKELQDELALNWYDFGARMYMPEIGRWGTVDPLAEKMRRWSPYNYAFDNPQRYIDPDGMEPNEATKAALKYLSVAHLSPTSAGSDGVSNQDDQNDQGDPDSDKKTGNLIVHMSAYDKEKYKGSEWNAVQVSGLDELLKFITEYTSDGTVLNNLVINTHGNALEFVFPDNGETNEESSLSMFDVRNNTETMQKFNKILSLIGEGGNVVMAACFAGQSMGGLAERVDRKDLNIYLNKDYTSMGKSGSGEQELPYVPFGKRLTMNADLVEGWMKINKGEYSFYSNLKIQKNGKIEPVEY